MKRVKSGCFTRVKAVLRPVVKRVEAIVPVVKRVEAAIEARTVGQVTGLALPQGFQSWPVWPLRVRAITHVESAIVYVDGQLRVCFHAYVRVCALIAMVGCRVSARSPSMMHASEHAGC